MPVVSVLMPVYNCLPYLAEAVTSILRQSYADLELVALDDCSTDGSWELLQQLAGTDQRLRIQRQTCNCGVPATRNRLFELADPTTEFLAIMDSDDVADPQRLERQITLLRAHPELAGTGSWIRIIDTASRVMAERRYPLTAIEIRRQAIRANPFAHPTLCFRRELLHHLGGYDPQLASCEDYDFILKALLHCDMANLPDFLLDYRMSPQQWKQAHLRDSLLATLAIQRRYLFRRPFFSVASLCSHLAKYPLLLLPQHLILRLFMAVTYRKVRGN